MSVDVRNRVQYAFLVLCLLCSVGCQQQSLHRRIVIIPRLAIDARWLSLHVGLQEEAKRKAVGLYWNGPAISDDVQRQIDLAERAVQSNAMGIIAEPGSYLAMNSVLQEALNRKIPVVLLRERLGFKAGPGLSYVLTDDSEAGRLVAERLQKVLHGKGKILLSGLCSQVPGNIERAEQIVQHLHLLKGEIEVAETLSCNVSAGYSRQQFEEALQRHPDVGAIVSLNPIDAASAVDVVGRTQREGRVKVIAIDQNSGVFRSLRDGQLDSILVDDLRSMGRQAVDDIVAERAGKPHPLVSVVKPVLVDRDNLDTEDIQQLLLMHRGVP
ncbi:sugar ABC transporter substrate-binding protein [Silvibacterium acidisoli]|uniref:sugar ABC transporter substrate-binding protein n=1 Tax=Acidobacteriaceae bacterium ZG23-2 TaxID=2883246 RepID=UPI00406C13DC